MNEWQVFTRVVLPPALGRVWPAMVSQIVIVMLGSAVCGQIAAQELSYAANLIQSRNFRAFEAYIVATAIYLALAIGVAPVPELGRASLHALGRRWRRMVDFSLWDILRNLLLAARWTVAAVAHRLRRRRPGRAGLAAGAPGALAAARRRSSAATCSCSRARRC